MLQKYHSKIQEAPNTTVKTALEVERDSKMHEVLPRNQVQLKTGKGGDVTSVKSGTFATTKPWLTACIGDVAREKCLDAIEATLIMADTAELEADWTSKLLSERGTLAAASLSRVGLSRHDTRARRFAFSLGVVSSGIAMATAEPPRFCALLERYRKGEIKSANEVSAQLKAYQEDCVVSKAVFTELMAKVKALKDGEQVFQGISPEDAAAAYGDGKTSALKDASFWQVRFVRIRSLWFRFHSCIIVNRGRWCLLLLRQIVYKCVGQIQSRPFASKSTNVSKSSSR